MQKFMSSNINCFLNFININCSLNEQLLMNYPEIDKTLSFNYIQCKLDI